MKSSNLKPWNLRSKMKLWNSSVESYRGGIPRPKYLRPWPSKVASTAKSYWKWPNRKREWNPGKMASDLRCLAKVGQNKCSLEGAPMFVIYPELWLIKMRHWQLQNGKEQFISLAKDLFTKLEKALRAFMSLQSIINLQRFRPRRCMVVLPKSFFAVIHPWSDVSWS